MQLPWFESRRLPSAQVCSSLVESRRLAEKEVLIEGPDSEEERRFEWFLMFISMQHNGNNCSKHIWAQLSDFRQGMLSYGSYLGRRWGGASRHFFTQITYRSQVKRTVLAYWLTWRQTVVTVFTAWRHLSWGLLLLCFYGEGIPFSWTFL